MVFTILSCAKVDWTDQKTSNNDMFKRCLSKPISYRKYKDIRIYRSKIAKDGLYMKEIGNLRMKKGNNWVDLF
jgi:hypothetical protein